MAGEVKEIPCKDHPNYEEVFSQEDWNDEGSEFFSTCLAAVRPGCVGDNFVQFNRLNYLTCECNEQLVKRFREFVVTGMCHACQVILVGQMSSSYRVFNFPGLLH